MDKGAIIPDGGQQFTIYDFYIFSNDDEFRWAKWKDYLTASRTEIPENISFTEIVVETVEMLRIQNILS